MSDSLAEHFKKSLEVLDEAYDYVSQQPYGETSTERNQRHGFLDVLGKHTAATKEVLSKHLAAKEPIAGVEEVVERIAKQADWYVRFYGSEDGYRQMQEAIRAELASLPLPENVLGVLREVREALEYVNAPMTSPLPMQRAEAIQKRIDQLLGGDDGKG